MDDGRIRCFLLNALNTLLEENNKKHIIEITVLTIKSLLPSKKEVAVRIDYERFRKEMELWYFYRNYDNKSLLNSIDRPKSDVYFLGMDDSAYIRISPIVLSNNNWEVVREEVLKNTLYTTGNIETLLEGLLLSKVLFLTLRESENMLDKIKEEIINLSQINFLESYKNSLRFNINNYPGNFHVDFERLRIEIINILNDIKSKKFKFLSESLKVVKENIKSEYSPFVTGLYSLKNNIKPDSKEDISIYESFSDYIYKLNKGRIEPELLYIDKYILPDIFSFDVGDVFYHSLLNKCKVIKREEINDKIIVFIDTKSGIYKFKKQRPLI